MQQQVKHPKEGQPGAPGKQRKYASGELPDDLPDHFFNEDGEVDLRQVTGKEAYKFFSKMGIKLPIIHSQR